MENLLASNRKALNLSNVNSIAPFYLLHPYTCGLKSAAALRGIKVNYDRCRRIDTTKSQIWRHGVCTGNLGMWLLLSWRVSEGGIDYTCIDWQRVDIVLLMMDAVAKPLFVLKWFVYLNWRTECMS